MLLPGAGGVTSDSVQRDRSLQLQQNDQAQQGQILALRAAAAQHQQQQAQQYQSDVADYFKDPAPTKLASLVARYPDQAGALKQSYDVMEAPVKETRLTQFGQLYSTANSGRTDLAADQLDKVIAAEQAQGIDASDAIGIRDRLKAGDKDALTSLKAFSQVHLAAASPEFAKTMGIGKDTDSTHVINDGGALVDDTGKVLYRAGRDPKTVTIKNADGSESIVQVGGGDPASTASGAPPAGRTTGGWTPRARNGGDNSDEAVDSKIAGVRKALGVDPGADISSVSPMAIAQALTLSEGGSGSLADRNNNPANLRNSDGSYKKFPTKDAGLAAAAALVRRKLNNGQTTVESMIEGKPVGGPAAGGANVLYTSQGKSDAASTIRPGDINSVPQGIRATVQAIVDGRSAAPRPGTRYGEALLDAAAAYDPTFDAANSQSRIKTRVDFTSGKSAQAVNSLNTAMGHLLHLDDQAHDLGNFSVAPGLLNPLYNAARTRIGNNTSIGAFSQTKQAAASEMRKVFAGAAGGSLAELEGWEKSLDSSQSYEQLHEAIKNGVDLMASRLSALQDQYSTGMGRSDKTPQMLKPSLAKKAAERFGVDLAGGSDSSSAEAAPAAPAPPPGGKRIGTYQGKPVFQLPNGKRVVAQ